jgi:hypothetical protein
VIEAESQVMLNTLTGHYFQDAFKKWQLLWKWCICAEGDYFEGDGGPKLVLARWQHQSWKLWIPVTIRENEFKIMLKEMVAA